MKGDILTIGHCTMMFRPVVVTDKLTLFGREGGREWGGTMFSRETETIFHRKQKTILFIYK
jgi:hypothetical protein